MLMSYVFFFQAEDGIRYLVRSRGLGDVYKRQVLGAVQRWYDGTAVNNGWLIDREHTGNEGGSIQKGGWRFASKERKEDVPKLVVTWDPKS